jgi:hypothetical protein
MGGARILQRNPLHPASPLLHGQHPQTAHIFSALFAWLFCWSEPVHCGLPMHQQGPPSPTASNQNLLLFNLPSQQQTLMGGGRNLMRNSDSASNPNATSTYSRATLESALYLNLATMTNSNGSRPSSMLFNDAGFVRFRMGGNPGQMVDEWRVVDVILQMEYYTEG